MDILEFRYDIFSKEMKMDIKEYVNICKIGEINDEESYHKKSKQHQGENLSW